MVELRLVQGSLLKKVLEAMKDLVNDANFECSAIGLSVQAMDSSHVSLVSMLLRSKGFERYQCHRNVSMGINLGNMSKMLKCADNDDIITIKAEDHSDSVTFMFESPTQKISDFEMKLMDINCERVGIPDYEYNAIIRMPSAEFAKICKDLAGIGDSVVISVTKQGAKFYTNGDIGAAAIVIRQNTTPEEATIIKVKEAVSLTFALRFMNSFTKATPLSDTVTISLSSDLPVEVEYKIEGFKLHQYEHNVSMGMNLDNLSKLLKISSNDDIITIKAEDYSDTVTFIFESPSGGKIFDSKMSLMDISCEQVEIPDSEYNAIIRMPPAQFAKNCKDFAAIGGSIVIAATEEGAKFSIETTSIDLLLVDKKKLFIIKMEEPVSLKSDLSFMNSARRSIFFLLL
ncbi:hypothetical protein Pint_32617 [Pistacia integerrima]|uniref:Uncharacterized protein n=1 Tax=Pistacia integerrima TaxID=434235 RepID=A0ACC0XNX6_9ROSI|nr:hypothetical protein Pint_32617 [Pistacia integerrima]